jgi:hypothetical protein
LNEKARRGNQRRIKKEREKERKLEGYLAL